MISIKLRTGKSLKVNEGIKYVGQGMLYTQRRIGCVKEYNGHLVGVTKTSQSLMCMIVRV